MKKIFTLFLTAAVAIGSLFAEPDILFHSTDDKFPMLPGELTDLDAKGIRWEADGKEKALAWDDVLLIKFASQQKAGEVKEKCHVALTNGGILRCDLKELDDKSLTVEASCFEKPVQIPKEMVMSISFEGSVAHSLEKEFDQLYLRGGDRLTGTILSLRNGKWQVATEDFKTEVPAEMLLRVMFSGRKLSVPSPDEPGLWYQISQHGTIYGYPGKKAGDLFALKLSKEMGEADIRRPFMKSLGRICPPDREIPVIWHPDERESVYFRDVALSPDGRLLASANSDHLIRVWDVKSGQLLHLFTGYWLNHRLAWQPDGKRINVIDYDVEGGGFGGDRFRVLDLKKKSSQTLVAGASMLAVAPSQKVVAKARLEKLLLISLPGKKEREVYHVKSWGKRSGVFSADSKTLYVKEKNRIKIIDVATAKVTDTIETDITLDYKGQMMLTADGKKLITTSYAELPHNVWTADPPKDAMAVFDLEKKAYEGPMRQFTRRDDVKIIEDSSAENNEHLRYEVSDGLGRQAIFLQYHDGRVEGVLNKTWSQDRETVVSMETKGDIRVYEKGLPKLYSQWIPSNRELRWVIQHARSNESTRYGIVRGVVTEVKKSGIEEGMGAGRHPRFYVSVTLTVEVDEVIHNPKGVKKFMEGKTTLTRTFTSSARSRDELANITIPHQEGTPLLMMLDLTKKLKPRSTQDNPYVVMIPYTPMDGMLLQLELGRRLAP